MSKNKTHDDAPIAGAKDKDIIDLVSRLPVAKRSYWLDQLVLSEINRLSNLEISDKDRKTRITEFFNKVRNLQTQLGLRLERDGAEFPWFLDGTKEMMSQLRSKSEMVLPGSASFSRKHLRLKLDVFKRIEREFKIKLNENGHPIGVPYGHDTSRLLCVSGMMPDKIGVRSLDNRRQREEKGLSNKMDEEFLSMVDNFLVLMYGDIQSVRVRIESKSQSGLPLRSYGRGYKTIAFMHAIEHIDELLQLVDSNDLGKVLDKFDILFAYLMGSRRQPDAGGKKRYVTSSSDREFGLGAHTLVDNSVKINDVPEALAKHFATMRFRMVWGGNIVSNTIVNTIASSARKHYGDIYAFTLKHRGGSDILEKIKSFSLNNGYSARDPRGVRATDLAVVAIDVTQFDGDYPAELLLKYADFFKDTPIHGLFLRQMLGVSIQLLREDKDDGPDLTGDPFNFNPLDFAHSGMPSGWSWVSDTGKIMVVAIYFSLVKAGLLKEHTVDQLDAFMRGECEYGLLNLGDDNVILGPPGTNAAILEALEKYCPWKCEVEDGTRFIGHIIYINDGGYYDVGHDPSSYLTNLLSPERGIDSNFRKYWAVGYEARKATYLDSLVSTSFHKILKDCWKEIYNSDLDAIVAQEREKQELEMIKEGDDLGSEDAVAVALLNAAKHSTQPERANHIITRYLSDPSVLSWEFSRDEILEVFGLDLYDIEGRPSFKYTDEVLARSGYLSISPPNSKDSEPDEGQRWLHKNLIRNALSFSRAMKRRGLDLEDLVKDIE